MRYIIELGYKGTHFHGWQRQPNAISVQEVLEDALSKLLNEKIAIVGSSRTDTGVHARQQFAHFDTSKVIDCQLLTSKLNAFLREDIVVYSIYKSSQETHTRFDAIFRKYIYRIETQKNPFSSDFVLFFYPKLDVNQMNKAAALLLEHTDFECFSKVKTNVNSFECKISEAIWVQNGTLLEFHIQANRFLRGMVRAIVGTLLDVGIGKISEIEFKEILNSKNRNKAGKNVEAKGLTLEKVGFPENYLKKMVIIRKANLDEMEAIKNLFIEYEKFLGVSLCFQGFQEELSKLPYHYAEPQGTILLAEINNQPVGVIALKPLEGACCEMKRLYVKNEFRGLKIGEKLVDELLLLAKTKGYSTMKLDTLKRLSAAIELYRKKGFIETQPYNFNPEEDIVYFEKKL